MLQSKAHRTGLRALLPTLPHTLHTSPHTLHTSPHTLHTSPHTPLHTSLPQRRYASNLTPFKPAQKRRLSQDNPPKFKLPPNDSTRLEIPFSAFLLMLGAAVFWWTTRGHTLVQNEIPFSLFVESLLKKDCVERLEVINRSFVRVILKNSVVITNDSESGGEASDFEASQTPGSFETRLEKWRLNVLARIQASFLVPPLPAPTSVCCFEVGDLNNLETLLHKTMKSLASSSAPLDSLIPPIYYKDEIDYVQLARSYVPTLIFTAASFITFAHPSNSQTVPGPMNGFGGNGGASVHDKILKFGKASPVLGKDVPVKFSDVAGLEQPKKEVAEFVEFLKHPKKFTDLGAEIPKGALLVGPPGTGKTLLARAVAGEAGVPFYSMSGSDFMELFVGVGPSRIRDLFDRARKNAPAIIFIDEIDTIGRSRAGAGFSGSGGNDERESTLNALLVELDGFTTKSGVIILGGTNRGDVLDSALTRPGRFDRQIALGKPTVRERKEIFDIHLKPVQVSPLHSRSEVAKRLAALTPGFTGAEIKSVCNEAAIIAARRDATSVSLADLEGAVERLIGGLRHTGEVLTPGLKKHVAYHEAGHAVCGWFLKHADPVLKLSIVPRASGSLGYTQLLPDEVLLAPKEEILAKICVLMGGRASEHLFAGTITTGATDDLEKATRLARSFVAQLGFDEEMGLISYPLNATSRWPGAQIYSEATLQLIDRRVRKILDEQWTNALNLLKTKTKEVEAVASKLMEMECISFTDLKDILGARPTEISQAVRAYVEAMPTKEEGAAQVLQESIVTQGGGGGGP